MSVLNFAISDYQVLVGNLDVTNLLTGLGFAHNNAEVGEPLIWSGTLSLTNPLPPYQLSESLDNLINPGRWAKGAYPIKIYFWGTLFLTLRILDYNYDPDTQTAEATLTDKLGLIKQSGEGKDKPLKGFAPSASINLQGQPTISRQPWVAIALAMGAQGSTIRNTTLIPETDIILPDNPGRATYSNPPSLRGDAVAQLANVASASANLWVWCDKNENIRFCSYPRLGSSPIYRLSREQVEDFKRLPPDPADEVSTVEVVGESSQLDEAVEEEKEVDPKDVAQPLNPSAEDDPNEPETVPPQDGQWKFLIVPAIEYPIITESPPHGDLQKRHKEFQPIINEAGTLIVRKEQTEAQAESVVPETKLRGLIVSEENSSEESYNSKEGKLLKKRILKKEPLGKIASDIFPGETARITSEDISEEWEYDTLSGIPRQRVETIRRPECVVFKDKKLGTGRIPAEKTYEIWVKLWGDITGVKYRHEITKYKTKGALYPDKYPKDATLVIDPDGTQVEIIDYEPQVFYKETTTPISIKSEVKDKEFDNTGEEPGAETEETIELTDVPEDNALDEVAETAGSIKRQRIGAHDISHPFRKEDLLNFQPFRVVDVHTGRFVRDEFKIALGEDKELSCLYVGNLMGVISPVPHPPTHILIKDGASTDIPLTEGATITPIRLQSGQGVAPFTYSADTLPDGLTLSGNEITGTPTATGESSVTITVTDAASNTYTQVLNFNSAAVPPAIAHYRQISRFSLSSQYQGTWLFLPAPRTSAIEPESSTTQYEGFWQLDPLAFRITAHSLSEWSITSVSYAPINVSHQGEWKIEPLYFRNISEYQGEWEIEQIAQFLYGLHQGNWYLSPVYAPIIYYDAGDWSVVEVLPPSAEGHIYTVDQSSVYSGDSTYEGTYTKLTDNNLSTGAAIGSYAGYIAVDFGEPVVVNSVKVGAGTIGAITASTVTYSLNRCVVQYSEDGFSWELAITISGVVANSTQTFTLDGIIAQYWRITNISYEDFLINISTSEFSFT